MKQGKHNTTSVEILIQRQHIIDRLKFKGEWNRKMKFHILTTSNMKTAVFWILALFNMAEVYRRFRKAIYLYHLDVDSKCL